MTESKKTPKTPKPQVVPTASSTPDFKGYEELKFGVDREWKLTARNAKGAELEICLKDRKMYCKSSGGLTADQAIVYTSVKQAVANDRVGYVEFARGKLKDMGFKVSTEGKA